MSHKPSLAVTAVATAASPYTVLPSDDIIEITTALGDVTVNLPAVAVSAGRKLTFVYASGTDDLILDGNAAEQIDGAATLTRVAGEFVCEVYCDGSKWTSQDSDPKEHAANHQNGNYDEISVAALSGQLADDQLSLAHAAAMHANGGTDELSVAGLSGALADAQPTTRANITADTSEFRIDLLQFGVSASMAALPGAGDSTSFGRTLGAHGTGGFLLEGSTPGAGGSATETARVQFVIPAERYGLGTITLRVRCKFNAALNNTTNTIDAEVHLSDDAGSVGADICTTGAQTATTGWADYDFVITPTGIVAGNLLDIELTCVADDSGGTGGAPMHISNVEMIVGIQG